MSFHDKSPETKAFLNSMSESMFGRRVEDCINSSTCVTCGGEAKEFTDEKSKAEFNISGQCQSCQDQIFGVENEY